jgi:predicted peptidase
MRPNRRGAQHSHPVPGNLVMRTILRTAQTLPYRVFVPKNLERPAPVILFLHGAGECGDDGLAPTTVGIGPAIRRNPERFPAIVVFPQCPYGAAWRGRPLDAARLALEQTVAELGGDDSRLYLTGISMGGYGTWSLARRDPKRFAALVPVCGGTREPEIARLFVDVPVWIFHGDADTVIPVSESRVMAEALRRLGGDVRYTEYAGVGHNSWDRAYAEPELMPWLLAQRRGVIASRPPRA